MKAQKYHREELCRFFSLLPFLPPFFPAHASHVLHPDSSATMAIISIASPIAPAFAVRAAASLLIAAAFVADAYLRRALTDEATELPYLAALKIATARAPANVVVARIDLF